MIRAAVVFGGISAIVLFAVGPAFGQTVPALAEVPLCSSSPERTSLTQQREALTTQRNQLRASITGHDSRCQNVPVGSSEAAKCAADQGSLNSEKNAHIDRSNVFNLSVKAAEAGCGGASQLPAVVARIKGSVFLETTAGRTPIVSGTAVVRNARIVTGTNSAIELQYSSGERLEVGPNSSLAMDTNELSLVLGTLRLVHKCLAGNAGCYRQVYRVRASGWPAGIRGTDVVFETTGNRTRISVFEGIVDVAGASGQAPASLRQNQRVEIDSRGELGRVETISSQSAPNWWN